MDSGFRLGGSIEANIVETITAYRKTEVPRSNLYVVAVSGGPDSVALLLGLVALRSRLGINLHVAHYNHNLRSNSSDDAEFVTQLTRKIGIPSTIGTATDADYKRLSNLSPEAAARELRYAFLARIAQKSGTTSIVIGHTADDQAETVLLHLVRGSATRGLAGMATNRKFVHDGTTLTLLRPLLNVTHKETIAYCKQSGTPPITDPTNSDTAIPRNRLRLEIIPKLSTLNPKISSALRRLAYGVSIDMDYIDLQTDAMWEKAVIVRPDGVLIDTSILASTHPALIRNLLRRAFISVQGTEIGLEQVHIEGMAEKITSHAGTRVSLPGKLTIEYQRRTAWLSKNVPFPCPLPALATKYDLIVPGRTDLDGWIVNARFVTSNKTSSKNRLTAYFDQNLVGSQLSVRTWGYGDRFSNSRSLSGTRPSKKRSAPFGKKLQDILVNHHIPKSWRDRIPLVTAGEDILWIVGWQVARWAQANATTERILELGFSEAEHQEVSLQFDSIA